MPNYEPTPEDYKKAEDILTDEQRKRNYEREKSAKEAEIEFEDIEGIKVDKRCSDGVREKIRQGLEWMRGSLPLSRNGELSRLEHSMGGSSVPIVTDPFMPLDLIGGRDIEEVKQKREEQGLNGEQDLAYYSVEITDEGWQWIIEKAKELFPDLDFSNAPNSFPNLRNMSAEELLHAWKTYPWGKLAGYGLAFRRQACPLDENGRAPFPNIIKVGFDVSGDFFVTSRRPENQRFEYFESDPKLINYPSREWVGAEGSAWEIFEQGNYHIEEHPEWDKRKMRLI